MTPRLQLYIVQLLCYGLALAGLVSGQWLVMALCLYIVILVRGQMVMRQQLDYLLSRDDTHRVTQHMRQMAELKQVDPVRKV